MNKTFKLDINGQTQLAYDLDISFDRMAEELDNIERDVLNVGANHLKNKVKQSLSVKMPASNRPVRNQLFKGKRSPNGYPLTTGESLMDAVRQTSPNIANKLTKVHILGSGKANSPTFMTRFFEKGTEPRYAVRYKGKTLKQKRYTGRLRKYQFFEPVIGSEMESTMNVMGQVYEHKINDIINE